MGSWGLTRTSGCGLLGSMTRPQRCPRIPHSGHVDIRVPCPYESDREQELEDETLQQHLFAVHRNEAALGLSNDEAVDQHSHEHFGPGGLRLHDHVGLLHMLVRAQPQLQTPFAQEYWLGQYVDGLVNDAKERGRKKLLARHQAAGRMLMRHAICSEGCCTNGFCHTCNQPWPCLEVQDLAAGYSWEWSL